MKFQPIVDTSGHTILGHECLSEPPGNGAWGALRLPSSEGLYFLTAPPQSIRSCIEYLVTERGFDPKRIMFQMYDGDAELAETARGHGAGIALHCTAASPGFLERTREMRPEFVKLDGILTRNAEQPASALAIRKVVESADRLGLRVIANGVERSRTVENLWLLGVEIMQGDLFGRPAQQTVRMSFDLRNLASALAGEVPEHAHTELG